MSLYDVVIGVDNGVTGTIGIINCKSGETIFIETPTFSEQNYTKAKANITRINTIKLTEILREYTGMKVLVLLERPMVNPGRFQATVSALRALESTLVVIESFNYARMYVDSKEWQKKLLPNGCEKEQLKPASVDIGKRLFPQFSTLIEKHKDADGILIAEYGRRTYNN